MSIKIFRFLILLFTLILSVNTITAQQPAPSSTEGFKLFFEKVYLHLDRTYYASGEDIWFKAYLVNAQNNTPLNTSNNLYVELIDPAANIISRKVVRIDRVGVGDFQLDDSIASGPYRIRAYTNWMRNFGSRFIFEKEIQVTNIFGVGKTSSASNKSTTADKKQASLPAYKIQFLPEGGTMVEDVQTLISFKAEDVNGKGIEAQGYIKSLKGDTVARFNTIHLGMGSFAFTPKAGVTYRAFVKYRNDNVIEVPLPAATPSGFVMNVIATDPTSLTVNVNSNAATAKLHPLGIMNIAARYAGKSYYKQQIVLKEGKAVITIPKKDFPTGIAYITLYDESMHPHCERLVYIENASALNVIVSTPKINYGSKEKTTIEIAVTDAQQQPVKASLSLAAVDGGTTPLASGNIMSHLLLESDLRGKIENPLSYFDKNNNSRLQQLDLLLRTQGWRSFLWRHIADTNLRISYLPEAGITISGKVTKVLSKKPLESMNVTLFAPNAKGDKIYLTKTNASGSYYLDGLPLYGMQTIKLNVGDGIGKTIGAITMDTLFNNQLPVTVNPFYTPDTSAAMRSFAQEAAKRTSLFKNSQWFNILPKVTVTNKRGKTILRDGTVVVNFGYPEYNFNITPKDYAYQRLRDFIVQKVPGALYDEDLEGVNFLSNGRRVRPLLIVNKQQDVFGRLDYYSLPMEQIEHVHVRHVVGSPTYNAASSSENEDAEDANVPLSTPRGIRDYFLVTLQVKPGNYNQQFSKINADVNGYYEGRVFYSPNYSKEDTAKEDKRITIHWEPYIKTDANGRASVTFYNADPKTNIRVDVQGLTDSGIPIAAEVRYDVK